MRPIFLALWLAAALQAAKTLDVYFIDVEGGQATLIVTPSGQSMLVDTGWKGFEGRDADRIYATAKKAGVKKLDYLLITHYHSDHVGGISAVLDRMPVLNFVDHGANVESGRMPSEFMAAYQKAAATGKRITVKPGDKIPMKGVDVQVVASAGDLIKAPLPGAGKSNPLCGNAERRKDDPSENAQSVGFLLTFGDFKMINLGDLTWNKELEIACPSNRLGAVDVYITSHHGIGMSGSPALVHGLAPRVAITDNGARKGGSPEVYQTLRKSPGIEDIWQLHYSIQGGKENNPPDTFLANLDENCAGQGLKLSALPSGEFTVINTRNKYQKTYTPRPRS